MDETGVVTCFLRHEGAVLLCRRSEEVGSYPGLWGAVAGHAEGDPEAAAREEIREETGLGEADVALVRRGDAFPVIDAERGTRWIVHPYLFDCETREVATNWETAAAEWVAPTAILHRETVPKLWASYDRVRPRVETVATDREHGAAYISVRALEVLRDGAGLAGARGDADWADLADTARSLLEARPSMSVVTNRVNRAMYAASAAGTPGALEHVAAAEIDHAVTADRRAAERAAERIAGLRVATLSRSGTVLAALRQGSPEAVLVAESRPGREGVTVAETLAEETEVTLTTDAGLAGGLAEFDADALLVGADTVLADGRVVNKVGTRAAALASSFEGIDVLVAAAADKLSPDGRIDLEPRSHGEIYEGDAPLSVRNPTFDVTPPDPVDAVVTERGALDMEAARAVAEEHRRHAAWDDRE